jgi:hypothetical protein
LEETIVNNEMNLALIFIGVCFAGGVGMILWRTVISEAIRDRKIFVLAKQAKTISQPVEVTINLIPIERECGYMPDESHFDVESNGQHWYFSSCTLRTLRPRDGEQGMMYVLQNKDFKACYIDTHAGSLLGTLSEELPDVTGSKTNIQSLKDADWRKMYS